MRRMKKRMMILKKKTKIKVKTNSNRKATKNPKIYYKISAFMKIKIKTNLQKQFYLSQSMINIKKQPI